MSDKPKREFKPLPKLPDGKVDRDLVKAQYMESQEISISGWCEEVGYNRNRVNDIGQSTKAWREEKMARFVTIADDEAKDRAVKARADLLNNQLRVITETPALLFRVKNLIEYVVRSHEIDAQLDVQDTLAGAHLQPGWKRRSRLDGREVSGLAQAARTVTEGLQRAVMIQNDHDSMAMRTMQSLQHLAEQMASTQETETKHSVQIKSLGQVDPTQMRDLFKQWIDKPQNTQPPMPQIAVIPAPQSPDSIIDDEDDDG